MEAYKNQFGTILIDDPESKEVKVWRNFWCCFRVYIGLHIVAFITSSIMGIGLGLIGETIESKQEPQQSGAIEVFRLSDILAGLGFTFGCLPSPYIINWHLKRQAKKRWIQKYGNIS